MARQRNTKYDAYIREQFQLGKSINDIYRAINFQVRQDGLPDIFSYMSVKNRHKEWLAEGSPGKLELVETQKLDDGSVVMIYRDKDNNKWTAGK